jgi:DNA-directed RNA polymerase
LVDKASDKFLFLAFCFEMNRLDNFLNNEHCHEFKTYLPIQLDGTCNGYQHLSMLANETRLFETLNLFEGTKKDDPQDFYQHVVDQTNLYMIMKRSETEDVDLISSYSRLLDFGFNRTIIKPAVMNKPYNATDRTLVKYIKGLLDYEYSDKVKDVNKEGKEITYSRG